MRIRDVRTVSLEYELPRPFLDADHPRTTTAALLVEVGGARATP